MESRSLPALLIKKDTVYRIFVSVILLLATILFHFIPNEIIWLLYLFLLISVILFRAKVVTEPSVFYIILGGPLIWTFIMSFGDNSREIAKGVFYLSVPFIMVSTGLQIQKVFDIKRFITLLVFLGTVTSIVFIFFTLQRAGFKSLISPYTEARFSVGSGSPASVLSLVIAIFCRKFDLDILKNRFLRTFIIIVSLLAVYLFASRLYWGITAILIFILALKSIRTDIVIFLSVAAMALIIVFFISVSSRERLNVNNSLIYKFINSLNEVTLSEYKSDRDINIFYRGFESYRAIQTFSEGSFPEIILGGGYAKLVDLKQEVLLAGNTWSKVPLIHNGFFFVLVKQGLAGLMFILIFFILNGMLALHYIKSPHNEIKFISAVLLGSTVSLFLANFVSCSMFTLEMPLLIIISGFISARLLFNKTQDTEINPGLKNEKKTEQ